MFCVSHRTLQQTPCCISLKMHCLAIQCSISIFCNQKLWSKRLESTTPASALLGLAASFSLNCSKLPGGSASEHQSVDHAKLFLSRAKSGFEIIIKKVGMKRQGCPWTMARIGWSPKQACRAPRINLDLPWYDHRSSLAIFHMQLCISLQSTMYTTTSGGELHGNCFMRFIWKNARPPLL